MKQHIRVTKYMSWPTVRAPMKANRMRIGLKDSRCVFSLCINKCVSVCLPVIVHLATLAVSALLRSQLESTACLVRKIIWSCQSLPAELQNVYDLVPKETSLVLT